MSTKKAGKRSGPVGFIRVPITIWVKVPIFRGMPRLSDLDVWSREMGMAIDMRPAETPSPPTSPKKRSGSKKLGDQERAT